MARSPQSNQSVTSSVYGNWSAQFKIESPNASYVLKSISDLLLRVESGIEHSYGKKLSLVHTSLMFTPRSREMLNLLKRMQAARQRSDDNWRWHTPTLLGRSVSLTADELVELLDIITGCTVEVTSSDYSTRRASRAQITSQAPSIPIALEPAEDGGYRIATSYDVRLIRSSRGMYLWQRDAFWRLPDELSPCGDFQEAALDREPEDLLIARGDLPRFCAALLEG